MVGPETQEKGKSSCHNQHTKSASASFRSPSGGTAATKAHWYSVNPSRSYKQGDETWKETDSLGFDDLLTMAELLRQAYTWIAQQQQADSTPARPARKRPPATREQEAGGLPTRRLSRFFYQQSNQWRIL